jgi:ABC-type multidrug transport system fused ATPase/permease subunit
MCFSFFWISNRIYSRIVEDDQVQLEKIFKQIAGLNALLLSLSSTGGDMLDSIKFKGFTVRKNRVTIGFDKLGLKLKNGKVVLRGVSGEVSHSRVTAIMGPSGCGKSVLVIFGCPAYIW